MIFKIKNFKTERKEKMDIALKKSLELTALKARIGRSLKKSDSKHSVSLVNSKDSARSVLSG